MKAKLDVALDADQRCRRAFSTDEGFAFNRGDRVRLVSTDECGVVLHTWRDTETDLDDCYVAFFGSELPSSDSRPSRIPYVLRHSSLSLCAAP